MTNSQTIEFLGLFDIFVVGFHNGMNAYVSMTADPSSRNFEKTLWVSISKGYNRFRENCSGRATPLGDLRISIGSPSPASGFQDSSMESSFQQGFSNFEAVQATLQFSQFQCFRGPATQPVSPFQGFGGPTSGFSLFDAQSPSFGGCFQPIAQGGSTDSFASQDDFIPVQPTNEPIRRQRQTRLEIRKGRVVSVEIPSGFSSGPSTSSTVGKKSPKAPTPIATTIANLEKKISRLERENPAEGSLNHSELRFAKAKLEKIRNSL